MGRKSRKSEMQAPDFKKKKRMNKLTKLLAILYLLALVVFEFTLVILDILPAKTLLIAMVVLGVVSLVIFIQLFFTHVKKWAKIMSMILSIVLIAGYSFGTVYAIKTLNFLGDVSTATSFDTSNVTDKSFNVLVTGMDVWGLIGEKGRSDVNMIVTVNPKKHKILLTSVPRDYQIRLMNHGEATDKLTHTGFYGVDDTVTSLEDLLGIDIKYYVKVNFSTIVRFVDAIGGVDVNVVTPFTASTYNPSVGTKTYSFTAGKNHLDGTAALAFARDRMSFTAGDNQRVKNQQLIFKAILKKSTDSTTLLKKYTKILGNISRFYEMSFSAAEVKALIKLELRDSPNWKIETIDVTGVDSSQATYTGGSTPVYVMAHNEESIAAATAKIKATMSMESKKKSSSSSSSDSSN